MRVFGIFSLPRAFRFYRPQILGCSSTLGQGSGIPGLKQLSQKTKKIQSSTMEITGRALRTPLALASANCQQSNYIHVSDGFNCWAAEERSDLLWITVYSKLVQKFPSFCLSCSEGKLPQLCHWDSQGLHWLQQMKAHSQGKAEQRHI